jgi:hypothetical protein
VWVKLAAVLLFAGALASLALLLASQFAKGDVYARGSTLRTGPTGASVLYEALQREGVPVSRSFRPLQDAAPQGATVLLIGFDFAFTARESVPAITAAAKAGNRVVLALDAPFGTPKITAEDWNLTIRPFHEGADDADADDEEIGVVWPSWFEHGEPWTSAREAGGRDVVIERRFGAGSVVLIASSRPFLNQQLRDNRDSDLLTWVLNGARSVIFDEAHLGTVERGGVMGLARKLRLQGVIAVVLLCALLFFWRASFPFPPVANTEPAVDFTLPADSGAGILTGMLERRIPPANVIGQCLAEWERDCARRVDPQRVEQAKGAAQSKGSPAEVYTRIGGVIGKQRPPGKSPDKPGPGK